MSNNVTYNVHITNIMGAVIGVARSSQPECLSIEDAIKLGLETIETIENMYYEDYDFIINGFIITDSRGVIYNRTGKQISGHKWVYWLKGEVGIPSCKGENTEEAAHKAAVRHIKNLSEVFLKNGIYHRSYYVKPFASWVPHWIPSDVERLQCQTVNLTPPATALIPNPTGISDHKNEMLPYETLLPFITKHQAITRARGLGLSDAELKAMGVEV